MPKDCRPSIQLSENLRNIHPFQIYKVNLTVAMFIEFEKFHDNFVLICKVELN